MEVYVHDMLVKSTKARRHVEHLGEVFDVMGKYNMKLNLDSSKFLGFMVSNRGIEANPEKIKPLQDMDSPRKGKEVQNLTRCITTLNRFISKVTDICVPFFVVLKRNKHFEWTPQCERGLLEVERTLRQTVSPFKANPQRKF